MTQDEFLLLLRKQAGAPEADSLAEKTLVTAWRMAESGDAESIKNAENILNFATVDPVVKNLVKQQFKQGLPAATPTPTSETELVPEPALEAEPVSIDAPVSEETNTVDSPVDTIKLDDIPETISIPLVEAETESTVPLVETMPEIVPLEPAPTTVDPVQTILTQSSITTPVTQTIKKETADDLISKVLAGTQDRKLSRSEEFDQLINKTKQEEVKKEVELEKAPAVIHTYDTTTEDEGSVKFHSVEDRVKADKAEPFFARCEDYLKKAYESGASSIVTSAENQFASLKNRFPEFVKVFPDRIAKIEALKNTSASSELDTVFVSGVTVKKGMTITSSHVYHVEKIMEQGATTLVFFTDEESRNYRLTSIDLERGLETAGIDADVFFDEFRVN